MSEWGTTVKQVARKGEREREGKRERSKACGINRDSGIILKRLSWFDVNVVVVVVFVGAIVVLLLLLLLPQCRENFSRLVAQRVN